MSSGVCCSNHVTFLLMLVDRVATLLLSLATDRYMARRRHSFESDEIVRLLLSRQDNLKGKVPASADGPPETYQPTRRGAFAFGIQAPPMIGHHPKQSVSIQWRHS